LQPGWTGLTGARRPFAKRLGSGLTGSNPVPSAASGAREGNGSAGLIGAGHRIGTPAAACGVQVRLLPLPLRRGEELTTWPNGEAPVCKAGHAGSSPAVVLDQRSEIRGQRSEIRDQKSETKPFAVLAQLVGGTGLRFRTVQVRILRAAFEAGELVAVAQLAEAADRGSARCGFESRLQHKCVAGVAQPEEAAALNPAQCGFKSHLQQ
jgi:hypothetical protein